MKLLTSLVMAAILCLAGCKDSKPPIPQNSYRLEVENLVDSKGGMLVKRLVITAYGKRKIEIKLGHSGGRDMATARPDRQSGNGFIAAEIIIVADLIDGILPLTGHPSSDTTPSIKPLRWLAQIKVRGATLSGPSLYTVPSTSTLEEIVSLDIQSGEHPIGQPLVLGQLQDKEILLTIE
jgi:hypothetical protein